MSKKITYNVISKYRGALMGLAIISILFFHYVEDCRVYQYNYNSILQLFDKCISSSSVDAFLFLSGFGLYYAFKKNNNLSSFFKKRLTKILIPYAFVAIPAWYWKDIIYRDTDIVTFLKDLLFISFFDQKSIWFWYILMIVVCYLIFPYIFEVVETASDRITEQMRAIMMFLFITVIALMLQVNCKDFFGNINIAFLRFPAFFIGCFIGKASYNEREIPRSWIAIMILSLLMLPMRSGAGIMVARYVVAFFNINLCILFAILAELLSRKGLTFNFGKRILEWFGKYSLELYLTHVAIRSIMSSLGYQTCYLRYEFVMVALSVIASIILKKVTNLIVVKLKIN